MIWCWLTFDGFFTWGNLIQMIPNDWSAVDFLLNQFWVSRAVKPIFHSRYPQSARHIHMTSLSFTRDIIIFHPGSVWSCIFLYQLISRFRQQNKNNTSKPEMDPTTSRNIKKTHLHLVHFHPYPYPVSSLCFSDKACRSWRQCSAASSTSRSWAKFMGIHPSGRHGSVETFRIRSNRYYMLTNTTNYRYVIIDHHYNIL